MSTANRHARIVPASFDNGWVLEINGDVQSHVDVSDPSLLRFEYLRRIGHVIDLCWPPKSPLRVLHLGAGALTLVRYVQATRPGSSQTVIELDSDLITLVTSELPLPAGTDMTVLTGDARFALQSLGQQSFDTIVLDIFAGDDTEPHLTDEGFYREILEHLADDGILLVNIGDDPKLQFFTEQARTLNSAVPKTGSNSVWTLTDTATLNQRSSGNLVLATGARLAADKDEVAALRSQLSAAGPHPGAVLTPNETASLTEYLSG